MCEQQVHILPHDCSGKCAGCEDHHQEKCDRAVLEKAEKQGYKGEFEKAFERIDTPKGVTLDDLRRAHKDDVRYFHGRINELEKHRDVLARRCVELETQVPKTVRVLRPRWEKPCKFDIPTFQGGSCSACGAVFWATANFCPSCGARFDWSEGGEA